jgi:hypothetical protein
MYKMTLFKNKIRMMLAMMFQECAPDTKNPNDKTLYYKDYEDDEFYGYMWRDWWPADYEMAGTRAPGPYRPPLEEIYYRLWPKAIGKRGYWGIWNTSKSEPSVHANRTSTRKNSFSKHEFRNDRYYSPVPPERRVDWEANPTRPMSS